MSISDLKSGDDREPQAAYPKVPKPRAQSSVAGIDSVLGYFNATSKVSACCYDGDSDWPQSD